MTFRSKIEAKYSEQKVGGYPSVEFTVRVSEGAAPHFRNLLELFNTLGAWGCSRGIETGWDGDGNHKLEIVNDGGVKAAPITDDVTEHDTIYVLEDGYRRGGK